MTLKTDRWWQYYFRTDYVNGINIHNLTNIVNGRANNEDCTEMKDWMLNALNLDDSRTYYSADSVDYECKSSELLYHTEFPNSLSPSGLPRHRLI